MDLVVQLQISYIVWISHFFPVCMDVSTVFNVLYQPAREILGLGYKFIACFDQMRGWCFNYT